jgi:hypothetical protein
MLLLLLLFADPSSQWGHFVDFLVLGSLAYGVLLTKWTSVYICLLCLHLFTFVYICLLLFTFVNICLHFIIKVLKILKVFKSMTKWTSVYICLLWFTLFTFVYFCLHLFAFVCICLHLLTFVYISSFKS